MPKFIRVGNQYVEEDPDFDPEEWGDEEPQDKMFRKELRESMDITQDEEQMDSLMHAIQNGNGEKREQLMGIEAEVAGYKKDGKGGYIGDKGKNKGKKMTEENMARINREVDKTMFNSDLSISDFPDYLQKALRDRLI